jgi:hypothetical protein
LAESSAFVPSTSSAVGTSFWQTWCRLCCVAWSGVEDEQVQGYVRSGRHQRLRMSRRSERRCFRGDGRAAGRWPSQRRCVRVMMMLFVQIRRWLDKSQMQQIAIGTGDCPRQRESPYRSGAPQTKTACIKGNHESDQLRSRRSRPLIQRESGVVCRRLSFSAVQEDDLSLSCKDADRSTDIFLVCSTWRSYRPAIALRISPFNAIHSSPT